MKRTKFMALALTAALMFTGAGYAYWSDAVTVENNVTTGHMDVDFLTTCDDHEVGFDSFQNYYKNGEQPNVPDLANIMEASANIAYDGSPNEQMPDKDKMILNIKNFYPHAAVVINGKMQNKSTIPVKFEKLNYTIAGLNNNEIKNTLKVEVTIKNQTFILPYDAASGELPLGALANTRLEKNEKVNVKVRVMFDKTASTIDTEDQAGIKLTLTPTFKQFNQ